MIRIKANLKSSVEREIERNISTKIIAFLDLEAEQNLALEVNGNCNLETGRTKCFQVRASRIDS